MYEKKVWLEKNIDIHRVKMFNDLLQIEPFEKQDYDVYSCLFVDEYGEKKLHFKIDEKLIKPDEISYLDRHYLLDSRGNQRIHDSDTIRLGDLNIEIIAVNNFKNRIKIKCKNEFGIIVFVFISLGL